MGGPRRLSRGGQGQPQGALGLDWGPRRSRPGGGCPKEVSWRQLTPRLCALMGQGRHPPRVSKLTLTYGSQKPHGIWGKTPPSEARRGRDPLWGCQPDSPRLTPWIRRRTQLGLGEPRMFQKPPGDHGIPQPCCSVAAAPQPASRGLSCLLPLCECGKLRHSPGTGSWKGVLGEEEAVRRGFQPQGS